MSKHTVANEVAAELKKHPGVFAIVNENTGKVATFMAPASYAALTPERVAELNAERSALVAELPRLKQGQRAKAEKRIRQIDLDLKRQRMIDESKKRSAEREEERPAQRTGAQSAQQALNSMSMADQTDVIQGVFNELRRVGAVK